MNSFWQKSVFLLVAFCFFLGPSLTCATIPLPSGPAVAETEPQKAPSPPPRKAADPLEEEFPILKARKGAIEEYGKFARGKLEAVVNALPNFLEQMIVHIKEIEEWPKPKKVMEYLQEQEKVKEGRVGSDKFFTFIKQIKGTDGYKEKIENFTALAFHLLSLQSDVEWCSKKWNDPDPEVSQDFKDCYYILWSFLRGGDNFEITPFYWANETLKNEVEAQKVNLKKVNYFIRKQLDPKQTPEKDSALCYFINTYVVVVLFFLEAMIDPIPSTVENSPKIQEGARPSEVVVIEEKEEAKAKDEIKKAIKSVLQSIVHEYETSIHTLERGQQGLLQKDEATTELYQEKEKVLNDLRKMKAKIDRYVSFFSTIGQKEQNDTAPGAIMEEAVDLRERSSAFDSAVNTCYKQVNSIISKAINKINTAKLQSIVRTQTRSAAMNIMTLEICYRFFNTQSPLVEFWKKGSFKALKDRIQFARDLAIKNADLPPLENEEYGNRYYCYFTLGCLFMAIENALRVLDDGLVWHITVHHLRCGTEKYSKEHFASLNQRLGAICNENIKALDSSFFGRFLAKLKVILPRKERRKRLFNAPWFFQLGHLEKYFTYKAGLQDYFRIFGEKTGGNTGRSFAQTNIKNGLEKKKNTKAVVEKLYKEGGTLADNGSKAPSPEDIISKFDPIEQGFIFYPMPPGVNNITTYVGLAKGGTPSLLDALICFPRHTFESKNAFSNTASQVVPQQEEPVPAAPSSSSSMPLGGL